MSSFWWKDVLRLSIFFRTIAKCQIGDGSLVSFWEDQWADSILSQQYPSLASFATNRNISVMEVMQADDLDNLFFLPFSQQALQEFDDLQAHLQLIPYDETAADRWTPVWGNRYKSRWLYKHIFSSVDVHPIFKAVWRSKCTPRIKFFAWLVPVDRLNIYQVNLEKKKLEHTGQRLLCYVH